MHAYMSAMDVCMYACMSVHSHNSLAKWRPLCSVGKKDACIDVRIYLCANMQPCHQCMYGCVLYLSVKTRVYTFMLTSASVWAVHPGRSLPAKCLSIYPSLYKSVCPCIDSSNDIFESYAARSSPKSY